MRKHALHLARIAAGLALTTSTATVAGILAPVPAVAATTSSAVATTSVNLRLGAGTNYSVITLIPQGGTMTVTGATTGSWLPVTYKGQAGYVYASYVKVSSASATLSTPTPTAPSASATGQKAANYALAQVGKAYAYGKTGPDAFDCSGLVVASYRSVGITVPHSHSGQAAFGTKVARADLRPGDVLALGSSMQAMAVYVGNDTIVIADGPGYGVRTDNLTNRLKWEPLYTARRYA